ncbi:MAG: flagellin FliC, partial [Pseudomonadota bacterium]
MALTVNTNTASLNAITNLNRTQRSLAGSYSRISSGLRITRAADDAAGLGVAESLGAQAASGRVAMRNTNDGISVIQTAEGAMDSVGDILARMRELAVQSSSETLAD